MKFFVIILFSLISFKSCLTDGTTIYVVMDDAFGLQDGSKVKCKGLDVGKINDIKIVGNKVVATVKLFEDFQPTKGSTAEVNLDNIFNGRNLTILPSSSTEFLVSGDTIYAQKNGGFDIINSLMKGTAMDSIMDGLGLDSAINSVFADSTHIKNAIQEAMKIFKAK